MYQQHTLLFLEVRLLQLNSRIVSLPSRGSYINNETSGIAGATHNDDKMPGEIILGDKYWDHDELTGFHPGAV